MSADRGTAGEASADEGSVLLLALGYALLAIVVIFVCVCATDLYLAQKRLDALADSAALAGTDGFTLVAEGDHVRAELTDAGVAEQAQALLAAVPGKATVTRASTPDGVSAQVAVMADWHPPLLSLVVPDGVPLRSTGTARTALR